MVTFIGDPVAEAKKAKLARVAAQNQYVTNGTPFVAPSVVQPVNDKNMSPAVWTKLDLTYKPEAQTTPFMWWGWGADQYTSWPSTWYRNPVATKQNPVVAVSAIPAKQQLQTPTPWNDIASLQDYINTTIVRQNNGEKLTPEEQLNVMRAGQMIQQQQQEQQQNWAVQYEQQLLDQTRVEQEQKRQQLAATRQTAVEKYGNLLQQQYGDKKQQVVEQWRQLKEAAGTSLSFAWMWRSTYWAQQMVAIQEKVNNAMDLFNQEKEAAIAKYEAELQGADNEILASYDTYIRDIQKKMADSMGDQFKATNEFNAKNAVSYQEKVDNILQLAQSQIVEQVKPEDEPLVNSYASLAIDSKWAINEWFLKSVPTYLLPHVLKKAAELKWAIPQTQEYQYVPWSEYQQWGIFNKATGKFEPAAGAQPIMWWVGWVPTLADRNNNPGNLRSSNAVPYTQWEGGFAKFATPEDGFKAMEADIKAKVTWQSPAALKVLWHQPTNLLEVISVYAPVSDGNNPQAYAQSVANVLWISPTTSVSQLVGMVPQLAKAMAQHEWYTWGVQAWLTPMYQRYAKDGNIPDNKDLRPLGMDKQMFLKQYEVRKDQQPESSWVTKEQATANRLVMSKLQTDPTITNYLSILNSKRSIDEIVKSWINEKNKWVVDQSLIMLFNKALDPNSVVREGEYARSSEWQALLWRIEAWYNTYAYWWQKISNDTRDEMVKAISTLEKAAKQGITMTRDRLKATAVDMWWTEQFVDNYFKWYIQDTNQTTPTTTFNTQQFWPVKAWVQPSKTAQDYLSSLWY